MISHGGKDLHLTMPKIDSQAARGQNRTTKTDWAKVPPYIRFRYERAAERLPAKGTVYELGCGIGVGLNYLATNRPDLTFIGFDNSAEAVAFGNQNFSATKNVSLQHTENLSAVAEAIQPGGFLVAMEVIEHLTDEELEFFKTTLMRNIDGAAFSFPYDQKNIEGTNHLQSIDMYMIFEIFPGFKALFLRRPSIKFVGCWKRVDRSYISEMMGIRGEREAISRIANTTPPIALKSQSQRLEETAKAMCKADGKDPHGTALAPGTFANGEDDTTTYVDNPTAPRWHQYREEAARFIAAFDAQVYS